MQDLRDKLLKAGLVTPDQATNAGKRGPAPREPGTEQTASPSTEKPVPRFAPLAPIPALPPLPGSRAHQRLEAVRQQELTSQIRAKVVAGQVAVEAGERAFHFVTRKGKLRRLDLSEAQAQLLEQGALAVVERQEPALIEHALVPATVAEEVLTLSPKSVRFFNRPGAPVGVSDEPPT